MRTALTGSGGYLCIIRGYSLKLRGKSWPAVDYVPVYRVVLDDSGGRAPRISEVSPAGW